MICETYADYRNRANGFEVAMDYVVSRWELFEATTALALGIERKGPMGLTPDAIKSKPEWKQFYGQYHALAKEARKLHAANAKRYAKETRAEIQARREAKLKG